MSLPNTSTKHIRFAFFAAMILFLALNVVLATRVQLQAKILDEKAIQTSDNEKRLQGPWPFWVSRAYLMREKAPDIVVFGSSQMGSATFSSDARNLHKNLDCATYRKVATLEQALYKRTGQYLEVFNFAMGGSMVSDALMLSRALLTDAHKPSLVVIGVNPRDFIDNDLPALSATDSFKYMLPYVSLGELDHAAYPDYFAHLDWVFDQYMPMKRIRLGLQSQFAKEITAIFPDGKGTKISTDLNISLKADKRFLQTISGSVGDVKPGEWLVPWFVPDAYMDNTKEYLHRYHNPNAPIYACEQKFFRAFLADMQAKNIPVLVVGMPSQPCNRILLPDSFWSQFRSFVVSSCNENGASFCDLTDSPQFVKRDYLDTVHLNAYGGDKLFSSIADAITRSPKLASLQLLKTKVNPGQSLEPEQVGTSATVGSWH
jgi:hypothetical protein